MFSRQIRFKYGMTKEFFQCYFHYQTSQGDFLDGRPKKELELIETRSLKNEAFIWDLMSEIMLTKDNCYKIANCLKGLLIFLVQIKDEKEHKGDRDYTQS